VAHACNCSIQEAETGGSGDGGQLGLHSKFKVSLSYIPRPFLTKPRPRDAAHGLISYIVWAIHYKVCALITLLSLTLFQALVLRDWAFHFLKGRILIFRDWFMI
jgi:hypothetical protein